MKCERLDVWKKAAALSAELYQEMADLRDFGFRDQFTRSGLSIPSNIAEGLERISEQEKIRFLDIARASGAELKTQIHIGMKIGYPDREKRKRWIQRVKDIGKTITGLISSIQKDIEK